MNGKFVLSNDKLTLLDSASKARILPAYYSDNYISLLPGETRTIEIECPTPATHGPPKSPCAAGTPYRR